MNLISRAAVTAVVVLAVLSMASTVVLMSTRQGVPVAAAGGAAFLVCGAGIVAWRRGWAPAVRWQRWMRGGAVLWWLVAIGLAARIGYAVVVAPVQLSDAAAYTRSATELAASGEYKQFISHFVFRAYLPPGYPAALSLFMRAGLEGTAAVLAANAAIFVACCLGLFSLLRAMGFERSRALAGTALFAIWPGMIPWFNLAFTDTLALTLVVWGLRFGIDGRRAVNPFLSGCLIAAAALTRGQSILFAGVVAVYLALGWGRGWKAVARDVCGLAAGVALLWGPWVVRNQMVLGSPVPFSTNGGDILYRANNEQATGGFMEKGERDYWPLVENEVQLNRMTSGWAKEWIGGHRLEFVKLSLKKVVLLMGEDHLGYYFSLRWAHPEQKLLYAACQVASNGWWIAAWLAILAGAERIGRAAARAPRMALLTVGILMVPIAVHSVFESGSRYHIPLLPAVLALVVTATAEEESEAEG